MLQTIDFTGFNSGSAQPSLNRNFLKNIPVLRPPVTVQRSIASILAALDDKLTVNDRIAQALLDLAGTLFLEAVAANESRMLTIGELADIRAIEFSDGYRTKKIEHGRPGLRILRAGDVRDSYLYPSGGDYVSSDYSRQIGSKASRPGDIVLTTKGTVGRVAVVADAVEPVVYSPQVCFFRVTDACQVDPGYLSGWFRSDDLQRQAATLMNKSDMAPYVSLRDVRSLTLPLLSISDQRRCGEVQNSLITIFEATRIENDRLVRTRDQLLPLLMSGKLAVRTAESIVEEMV
ncbi:hypothetical protein EB75_04085 [Mycobacterium sp. ST-F2]|nr:hypothetical protein EB75_04085 [Mycobacterium sp. ST-F2]